MDVVERILKTERTDEKVFIQITTQNHFEEISSFYETLNFEIVSSIMKIHSSDTQ